MGGTPPDARTIKITLRHKFLRLLQGHGTRREGRIVQRTSLEGDDEI